MTDPPPRRIFDSPCKSVCRIDDRLGWCIGCRRTRAEIRAWPTASEAEKRAILGRLNDRQAAEPGLLDAALPQRPPQRPP